MKDNESFSCRVTFLSSLCWHVSMSGQRGGQDYVVGEQDGILVYIGLICRITAP